MKFDFKILLYWGIVVGAIALIIILFLPRYSIPGVIVEFILAIAALLWSQRKEKHPQITFKKLINVTPTDFDNYKSDISYIERESDEQLRNRLKEYKNTLIIGRPMAGKTRTVYESLTKLKENEEFKGFWFVRPEPIEGRDLFRKDFRILSTNKAVVFFDDLDKFVDTNFPTKRFIKAISKSKKSIIVIVGTCRTGDEYKKIKNDKKIKEILPILDTKEIIEMRDINKDEGKKIAKQTNKLMDKFDGTPGSITLDLSVMEYRFEKLSDSQQNILRCMKLLYKASFYSITIELVIKVLESDKIFKKVDINKFNRDLLALENNSFISRKSGKLEYISIYHDVYYEDKNIIAFTPRKNHYLALKEIFKEKALIKELIKLGDFFIRNEDYQENYSEECYKDAIVIDPNYAVPYNKLGILYKNKGKREKAKEEFKKAIEKNPGYIDAYINLGELSKESGDIKGSERYFNLAKKKSHIMLIPILSLANLHYHMEQYKEAEEEFRIAIRIDPESIEAHNGLGVLLADLDKHKEAEKEFRIAIGIDPENKQVHYNLGFSLDNLRRYTEAEVEFKKVIEIDPEDTHAHYNLGLLLEELGRWREAEEEYKRAIEIDPEYKHAHNNLGLLLKELGRWREAEEEYKRAIEIDPEDTHAHNNLGVLLDHLGRYEEAEVEYKKVIEIEPEDTHAHYNLGLLLKELGRWREAEEEYKRAIEIDPEDTHAHNNLGLLLEELGRWREAEEEYKRAIEIDPEDKHAHNNLGILLEESRRYKEALEEYKRAIEIDPEDKEPHNNLGFLLDYLNIYEEAEKEYKRAIEIDSEFFEAHNNLGTLYAHLHRYKEAEKEYKRAIEINSDDAGVHYNLGLNYFEKGELSKAREILLKARRLCKKQGKQSLAGECGDLLVEISEIENK